MIYSLAAAAEIAGCFAFWAWLRLNGSALWAIPGVASLCLFAYAAYGGVYIAASLVWMWLVEKSPPDRWDLAGAALCLAGAAMIIYAPR